LLSPTVDSPQSGNLKIRRNAVTGFGAYKRAVILITTLIADKGGLKATGLVSTPSWIKAEN
jgi:hypothetical protein